MSSNDTHKGELSDVLVDRFNRTVNYLRISVTDKCNLRCIYCMSNEPYPKLKQSEILSYEEILRIVSVGAKLGINKIRITGGEPLFRRGLMDFLDRLMDIPGLSDVALTTNGMLLHRYLSQIKAAGIKRLNISLDSLKPDRFQLITGDNGFDQVWKAIAKALAMGFSPIKINVVAIPGVNDDELADFARLTFTYPFHIRFIEYMPIGSPALKTTRSLLTQEIKQRISHLGALHPVPNTFLDGPARRFRIEGAMGEVGFISPISQHFCKTCNRIRLTANGRLRLCLLSDESLDIGHILRNGGSDQDIAELFHQAAHVKHEKHRLQYEHGQEQTIKDYMASIGG